MGFASVSIVFDKLKQNRLRHSTPSSVTIVLSPAFICTEEVQEKALCGSLHLIYFSPEALLLLPLWRDMLKSPYYHNNTVCLAPTWWKNGRCTVQPKFKEAEACCSFWCTFTSDTCQYCSINNLYIDYQGRRKGVQELLSATYFGLHYQLFFVIIKVAK